MSTSVFPTLPGLTFDITRTPDWTGTTVYTSASGKRTSVANWSYPRRLYEMVYSFLRSAPTYSELQLLEGFFNSMKGPFDTFLFSDPDDNSVTGQQIATGDGTTAAFQLQRVFGSFGEPVFAPHTVSAVYLAGASVPSAGLSAPTNGALTQTTSGSLGATTYYVKSTWVTASGETLASSETALAASANNILHVAAPGSAPSGAVGWNVYVANSATGTGTETRQNGGTAIALGTAWVEPTSGLVAGAALPVANTTGWSVSTWGSPTPGMLTFSGTPASGIAISADFTYYFPCRFDDPQITFKKILAAIFSADSIKFSTEK